MEPNERQDKAITKTEGPCIILAGAGTGKSYTVVEKVSHLVNNGRNPDDILCLTFSNEATDSLQRKIQEKLQRSVNVKTFHAFCQDLLREDGHLIGISEDFEIILPDDAKILIHKYLDIQPYWAGRYITTISTARDFGISLDDYRAYVEKLEQLIPEERDIDEYAEELSTELKTLHLRPQNTSEEKRVVRERKKEIKSFLERYYEYEKFRDFVEAWEGYENLKKERNYLDFADLNDYALQLFRQFGSEKFSGKYVFVDEFQDTNKLQFELIEYIARDHNITVVGDPNQSIYGFRGAYKENFEQFKESFNVQQDDLVELDKSYRSTNKILNLAHDLIKNNYENPEECVKVQSYYEDEGENVKVVETVNMDEEARLIAEKVQEAIDDGVKMEEICVLHRTHRQASVIKRVLELKGIPVISAGRTNLMQKPEIRTAASYLSILANLIERSGFGEQSWWNLFHYQNSLSPEDSLKIGRFLKKNREVGVDEALLNNEIDLSQEGKDILERIRNKLRELLENSNKPLPELVFDVFEISGLNRAFTHERSIKNIESLMNLKKFYELAENYYKNHETSITGFINYMEIIDNMGINVDASKIEDVDAVRLMTIHAVKGLEFERVFVSNMAQDRFPITRTSNEPLIPKELHPTYRDEEDVKQLEKELLLYDERRLCYVAWTRAKKNLVITYARSYNDKVDSASESVFLQEVDYVNNLEFIRDEDESSTVIAPGSHYEEYKAKLKGQVVSAMDTDDFKSAVERLKDYFVCRDKVIDTEFSVTFDRERLERHLARCTENRSLLVFNPKYFVFSPTSMITYEKCPKKYELANLLRMPEPGDFQVTAASVGSLVHKICEEGVNRGFTSLEEYHSLCPDDEVKQMITVFWERNKDKIGDSQTEVELAVEIGGYRFFGIADRIDKLPDGTVEIIDYKTNKQDVKPDERAIQLGFYAIAAEKLGMKVSKLTLDMLRLDRPVEMTVENGYVSCGRMKGFSLEEVEKQLIEICRAIAADYESEFEITDKDDNCMFCGYKFYCPKWVE